jgi:hypothetical protein
MRIASVQDVLLTAFARINPSNAPDPDDGEGNFLSTVSPDNVKGYFIENDNLPGLPTIMVIPGVQQDDPKDSAWTGVITYCDFWVCGVVGSTTGVTDNKINASRLCLDLIDDCKRVTRSLFTSQLSGSTRFLINAAQKPIKTQPIRENENRYWFMFPILVQSEPK